MAELDKLMGIAPELFWESDIGFFKPFDSCSDAGYSAAAIIAAPFIIGAYDALYFYEVCQHLYKAIANVLQSDTDSAKLNMIDAGGVSYVLALSFIAALISPLVNLIDFIGSAINRLWEKVAPAEGVPNNLAAM